MRPPCEVVVKDVLPAIRAMLVKKLIERHELSQIEVARKLGITQPAVSQYLRMHRGVGRNNTVFKKIEKRVQKLADEIAHGKLKRKQVIERYCLICRSMGRGELICLLHMRSAPYLRGEGCRVCLPRDRS
ncbi:MAG TPA: helix-turn-helix domain-containing protein [Hadesarchaea archaeon]|nr:helix-turn-helix domain-containing protein [Hadesarchaea archaeon]